MLSALLGCSSGSDSSHFPVLEELDFARGLIFFEQWIYIEGKGEFSPSYLSIDFPTYSFSEEEDILVSFNKAFGSEEGKITLQTADLIIGEGSSLSGSAGRGTASGLQEIKDLPFTTEYQLLSIQEMRKDGSLLLQKASTRVFFFDFTFSNPSLPGHCLSAPEKV